jgi:DNA-binding transcriptional MerR regulator
MAEYSIGAVAGRAGAAQDYVSKLVELGVVPADRGGGFSEGDVRRVRLMQTLERAGVPLEEVAAAIRRGDVSLGFLDMSHFTRLSSLTDVTFQELSEKTNVPVELLLVIREAAGFAEPQPTDRVRENELLIARLIEAQIAEGVAGPNDEVDRLFSWYFAGDTESTCPDRRRCACPAPVHGCWRRRWRRAARWLRGGASSTSPRLGADIRRPHHASCSPTSHLRSGSATGRRSSSSPTASVTTVTNAPRDHGGTHFVEASAGLLNTLLVSRRKVA